MFNASKILYITDYDFGEEFDLRNKYLIILHYFEGKLVLVSLTTSVCNIPTEILLDGCIKHDDRNIHSYFFPKDKIISDNGFFFEKDTFININRSQVFESEIQYINTKYVEPGKTEEKCCINDAHFLELLYCIYKSKFIPKKTKQILEPVLEELSKKANT